MGFGKARVDREGSLEVLLCRRPVPLVPNEDIRERVMCFGVRFVEPQCCFGSGPRFGEYFIRRTARAAHAHVGIGERSLGGVVLGIKPDSRFKLSDATL